MPSTLTPAPHGRRRRRVKTPATSSGKENSNEQQLSNTSQRRRPLKPSILSLDDNSFSFREDKHDSSSLSTSSKHAAEALRQLLHGSKDNTNAANLWQDHPGLAEAVVAASLATSSQRNTEGFFLLEEHSSKLVSTARKLIKDATEESKETKKYQWLMVATHILRAVGPLLKQVDKQEACFRLFYHLITMASDLLLKGGHAKAAAVVVAGYEVLGTMLRRYSTSVGNESVGFEKNTDGHTRGSIPFILPVLRVKKQSEPGSMAFRQIATIALKMTLSVATCFTQLQLQHVQKGSNWSKESTSLFGSDVQARVENASHHAVLELLETVYRPWLSFSADFSDENTVKELSLHCKAAHRLLWDTASKLKDTQGTSDKHTLQTVCLELRQRAILMMLPRTTNRRVRRFLEKEHFEQACSYAWKASSVFAQQTGLQQFPTGVSNGLHDFHSRVGESLEFLRPPSPTPLAFVEYCFYRSLHTAWGPPLPLDDNEQSDTDECSTLLSFLFLCIHLRHKLESSCDRDLGGSTLEARYANADIIDIVQRQTGLFNELVISRSDDLSSDFRSRSFKLFSMISLHRYIFVALKAKDWQEKQMDLLGASLMLERCIGPVAVEMIRSCEDETKIATLYDTAVECSIRPLAAFEAIRNDYLEAADTDSAQHLLHLTDEVGGNLCSVLVSGDVDLPPPPNCIEKAAKSLSILARQRVEKSMVAESITPQLYSLQLYFYLRAVSPEDDYQLSSRFAQLATALQDLGKHFEASLALCLVLGSEVHNCYQSDKDSSSPEFQLDLLQSLATKCKGIVYHGESNLSISNLAKTAIRRLVNLLPVSMESCKASSCNELQADPMSTLDMLRESFLQCGACEPSNFKSIGHVLCRTLREYDTKDDGSTLNHKHLLLLIDFQLEIGGLVSLGKGSGKCSPEQSSMLLEEYQSIAEELQTFVGAFEATQNPFLTAATGLLHLVSSSGLLPFRCFYSRKNPEKITVDSSIEDVVKRYSRAYCQYFESANPEQTPSNCDSIFLVLGFSGVHYNYTLDCVSQDDVNISDVMKYGERCFHTLTGQPCVTGSSKSFATKSLVWSLVHLQNRFQRHGDFARVKAVAEWAYRLLVDHEIDSDGGATWFQSIVISAHINGGIFSDASGVLPGLSCIDRKLKSWSTKEYAEAELFAYRIRERLPKESIPTKLRYPSEDLESLKSALIASDNHVKPGFEWMSKWVLSTIELTQSELASSSGYFHLGLQHVQQCIRLCQEQQRVGTPVFASSVDLSFWMRATSSGHLGRVTQRLVDSLSHRSYLFQQVGDHRKVSPYLNSAGNLLGIDFGGEGSRTLNTILSVFKATTSLVQRRFLRLLVSMQSATSAFDIVEHQVSEVEPLSVAASLDLTSNTATFEQKFGMLRDLIAVGDVLYAETIPSDSNRSFLRYYEQAYSLYEELCDKTNAFSQYLWMVPRMQLRHVRLRMTEADVASASAAHEIRSICTDVAMDSRCLPEDKAWAYYYLGLLKIEESRSSGALRELWETTTQLDNPARSCESIQQARAHLLIAATSIPIDTGVLSRSILRSLALVNGPETGNTSCLSAGVLVLTSVGRSSREFVVQSLHAQDDIGSRAKRILSDAFSSFDGDLHDIQKKDGQILEFLDALDNKTPQAWKFVSAALCPSGELLVTSVQKSSETGRFELTTECKFTTEDQSSPYDGIIKPLDEIILRSQNQLNGLDQDSVSKNFSKDDEKRLWWAKRSQLDDDLHDLVDRVESLYFGSLHAKNYIDENGDRRQDSMFRDEDLDSYPRGNLASKFEEAVDLPGEDDPAEIDIESFQKLTVVKLKERLRGHGVDEKTMRKLRKQQLIDLLIGEERKKLKATEGPAEIRKERGRACLFLILDENLSRFPFEGMPSLQNRTVSRIPSLPFVLATLLGSHELSKPSQIDANQVSYVLDPEGNLQATRRRLEPVIETARFERDYDWDGCVGELPDTSFIEKCLQKENGLFLYFGHGGGQAFFSRRKIEGLIKNCSGSIQPCRATVVLMGCSSGRLVSVNRKHSKSVEQLPLHYEPEGIALSYLCAGAPCVVGNLWDVTDHDIDRFSVACIEQFFGGKEDGVSLPLHVSRSRAACKMRYIVGCAPVCYGIPVYLNQS